MVSQYNILEIRGGKDHTIKVGFQAQFFIDNIMQEWREFLNQFWKKKKNSVHPKYKQIFLDQLENILEPFISYLKLHKWDKKSSSNIVIDDLKKIYSLSDKIIFDRLVKYININNSIKFIAKKLFFNILKLNEKYIKKYLITKYDKNLVNNRLNLLLNILKKNKISTTSKLLLLVSTKQNIKDKYNIIIPHNVLLDATDIIGQNYMYMGYCNKIPIKRLILLLNTTSYLKYTDKSVINISKNILDNNKIINKTLLKVNKIIDNIENLNLNNISNKNKKKIKDDIEIKNIYLMKKIMSTILIERYEPIITKYIIPLEKQICDLSIELVNINKEIEKLI